jgi:hypothetical protein
MKRINLLIGFTLVVGVTLGVLGSRMSSAQEKDNLKGGKILQRTELKGAPGWEAASTRKGATRSCISSRAR